MKYQGVDVDSIVKITHQGQVTTGKVRRIGQLYLNTQTATRWAMCTLDVHGEVAYLAVTEAELSEAALERAYQA